MMKKEFKKWRSFLTEKEEKISQDRYEANLYLSIEQSKPIDRTEVMNQIRAIPEVTTVYREREVSTSARNFVGEYIIRFILSPGTDARHYYSRELKPRLSKINGLKIQHDFDFEKISDQ
tara:strand:+ start:56 stop:412 length:357 start_codon:yes stop_codon:yes gene_type:complete